MEWTTRIKRSVKCYIFPQGAYSVIGVCHDRAGGFVFDSHGGDGSLAPRQRTVQAPVGHFPDTDAAAAVCCEEEAAGEGEMPDGVPKIWKNKKYLS